MDINRKYLVLNNFAVTSQLNALNASDKFLKYSENKRKKLSSKLITREEFCRFDKKEMELLDASIKAYYPLISSRCRGVNGLIKELSFCEGYIYVKKISGKYKIGRTLHPKKRHAQYKTENPDKVINILEEEVFNMYMVEDYLKEKFSDQRYDKSSTREWFNLSAYDIKWLRMFLRAL